MSNIKPVKLFLSVFLTASTALSITTVILAQNKTAPNELKKQFADQEAYRRYSELHLKYIKWHEGLFGSRRYHERKLMTFLNELVGKTVRTGAEYMLSSPEGITDPEIHCRFSTKCWLYIKGEIDTKSISDVAGGNSEKLRTWWRSDLFISVSGKVRKWRLDRDPYGDCIILFLEKVTAHPD
jgi:hypothetical protein